MKLNIKWQELAKALWTAVKPVLLGALGGGIVSFTSGCSSMAPSTKSQTMSVVGVGVPAIVWVSSSSQAADNTGDDDNAAAQTNPVTVDVPVTGK